MGKEPEIAFRAIAGSRSARNLSLRHHASGWECRAEILRAQKEVLQKEIARQVYGVLGNRVLAFHSMCASVEEVASRGS